MDSAGAREFHGLADPASESALSGLLALGHLPTDRTQTWHAVASVLVLTDGGDVLLARNRSGGWGTVGGHVEEDDVDLRTAATRELAEEVGLSTAPDLLVPLVFLADDGEFRPGHAHWDFCFARHVPDRVTVTAADDVSEVGWFPIDAPPALNEHMAAAVAALQHLHTRR